MANQEDNQKAQSGGSKMLLVALALTNLLSLGGLAYLVVVGQGPGVSTAAPPLDDAVPPDSAPDAEVGPTVELGTFNITLADPGQNRYLKAILKARLGDADLTEEVKSRDAQIRDRVIDYLSSLTVKETQGSRSKAAIRENLKKRINIILTTGEIKGVYLTEFVTQ